MFTLTNINAMNAAQAVTRSHADVQTSMERLSTGSRINAARDDAAGLAVSQRMAAQIIGINKAIDNASTHVLVVDCIGNFDDLTESCFGFAKLDCVRSFHERDGRDSGGHAGL